MFGRDIIEGFVFRGVVRASGGRDFGVREFRVYILVLLVIFDFDEYFVFLSFSCIICIMGRGL